MRYAQYLERRNQIFEITPIVQKIRKEPKRSTLRLRRFYKMCRMSKKLLVSAIVSNPKDLRYYAKVSFLEFEEYGLAPV